MKTIIIFTWTLISAGARTMFSKIWTAPALVRSLKSGIFVVMRLAPWHTRAYIDTWQISCAFGKVAIIWSVKEATNIIVISREYLAVATFENQNNWEIDNQVNELHHYNIWKELSLSYWPLSKNTMANLKSNSQNDYLYNFIINLSTTNNEWINAWFII